METLEAAFRQKSKKGKKNKQKKNTIDYVYRRESLPGSKSLYCRETEKHETNKINNSLRFSSLGPSG